MVVVGGGDMDSVERLGRCADWVQGAAMWKWEVSGGGGCWQAPCHKQCQASGITGQTGVLTRGRVSQPPAQFSQSLWPRIILQFHFFRSGGYRGGPVISDFQKENKYIFLFKTWPPYSGMKGSEALCLGPMRFP